MPTGWTDEMDAELTRLTLAGSSYRQSAEAINEMFSTTFSRNAAIGRATRIGLSGTNPRVPRLAKPKYERKRRPRNYGPRLPDDEPPSQPPAALQCVEIFTRDIDLADLVAGDCRYPRGDGPFTFCGNPVCADSSYCGPHHALCTGYTPAPRRSTSQRNKARPSLRYLNYEAA